MKHKLRKGLAVGVICLLMLVAIPLVNAEGDYPKDEGPYTVFIGGKCNGGGIPDPITFPIRFLINHGYLPGIQFGPLSYWVWPWGPEYRMEEGSIFIVNGKVQDVEYPVQIHLRGFKGLAPALGLWLTKAIIESRIRTFGVCEEISLWYAPN